MKVRRNSRGEQRVDGQWRLAGAGGRATHMMVNRLDSSSGPVRL
eukprot:CAMPEP_0194316344 /NCGR_PEP_ID=MMETSP0171-20130528/13155_1 /TAXON_ID=218684 /ORGANISM="Corethron pennatum, Strain L29A3" /LENGTH=43 /DNA_ID= /DNA_START= /DNA_END= /DNA_ORIENTATION=